MRGGVRSPDVDTGRCRSRGEVPNPETELEAIQGAK